MDFSKISNDAQNKAIKAATKKSESSLLSTLDDLTREQIELYQPITKYINSLVEESLREYHAQLMNILDEN